VQDQEVGGLTHHSRCLSKAACSGSRPRSQWSGDRLITCMVCAGAVQEMLVASCRGLMIYERACTVRVRGSRPESGYLHQRARVYIKSKFICNMNIFAWIFRSFPRSRRYGRRSGEGQVEEQARRCSRVCRVVWTGTKRLEAWNTASPHAHVSPVRARQLLSRETRCSRLVTRHCRVGVRAPPRARPTSRSSSQSWFRFRLPFVRVRDAFGARVIVSAVSR
jgi:hypothetical protein